MMTPSRAGFSNDQSFAGDFVIVMKSCPRNTRSVPSTLNRRCARGERAALSAEGKSTLPEATTSRPGRNIKVAGLGVSSVWMNMEGSTNLYVQRDARKMGDGG